MPRWGHSLNWGCAEVGREPAYHEFLLLDAAPADESGEWWRVPDGIGPGIDGFISDQRGEIFVCILFDLLCNVINLYVTII